MVRSKWGDLVCHAQSVTFSVDLLITSVILIATNSTARHWAGRSTRGQTWRKFINAQSRLFVADQDQLG